MTEAITVQDYARAERDVLMQNAWRHFRYNATFYVIVNALLIAFNLAVVPEYLWFYFPLIGWGFGLLVHYVFGVRQAGQSITDLQARIVHRARNYAAP